MKKITTDRSILNEPSEILASYFKSISRYPIYSAKEQIKLAREAQKGNKKAEEKLIFSNLRFVVTCAKRYIGQGVPLNDLIQAGNYGLILSIKNFNPNKKVHFISFAVWYIRRELLKAIYNTGRTIRYPVTYISRMNKIQKASDSFIAAEERIPSSEEILDMTKFSEKQYYGIIENQSQCHSMDNSFSDDGKITIENFIAEESDPISDTFTKEAINEALKVLNAKEYKIVTEYYGLNGNRVKSVNELSREMELGNERIRQIRKEAIRKLRRRCSGILKSLL